MALFSYKAKTLAGETITGTFDASDRSMVVSLLRSKGYFPLHIKEVNKLDQNIELGSMKKISLKELSVFCKQFYTMINAGVAVIGCLDFLRRQTENKKLIGVINKVYDDLQKGMGLSESIKQHANVFPIMMINMIEIGEVSGTLDVILDRLSVHFEKENKVRQKIKTAMTYPMVIGGLATLMVIFMLAFVVPKFVGMFKTMGAELPLPTKILLKVSGTVTNLWFILGAFAAIVAFIYLFNKFKKSEKGKMAIDSLLIKLPLIGGNIKKILASRFTRSLSLLLKTGVPLVQALEVIGRVVDNSVVNKALLKIQEDIKRGSNLAGPLEQTGIFPAMVTQMISIGEESGSLDSIIETVADFYDDELDVAVSRLVALMEPILIAGLAVIVGGIVIAMIMPVFSMYQNMAK
ncbi:MAG: type II secretion system F family protein [Clostridia bacterium]|nr:type II secretion system F family protein [Clostridia bacterium]